MVRTIRFTSDPSMTDGLLADLKNRPGIISVSVQRGASVVPSKGDIVTVQARREEAQAFLTTLHQRPELRPSSLLVSSPTMVYAPDHERYLERQTNEASWEETMMLLRRETNVTHSFLALMFLAGAVAAVGLWSDTLHVVVGAMVIAPGFQPLVRLPLGLVTRHGGLARSGLWSAACGYVALMVGAAAMLLVLVATYGAKSIADQSLVQYWTDLKATGAILAVAGGAAGTFSVATRRSVLSAGAMISLALVPAAALVGMGLALGETALAGDAFGRLLVDVAIVSVTALAVLGAKRILYHKRPFLAGAARLSTSQQRRKTA